MASAFICPLYFSLAMGGTAHAATSLQDLSLEQLSNIVVTSAARREEALTNAAASIFVITAQDIRRSGVTSLPEALRLAPNLQVARADGSQYSISARGFNNAFANKLLVLIDGRTIYTPLYSGVFWGAQQIMLEDIDRIEVISGPGATLWGANAVNGVINVITRSAEDTQGGLVAVSRGNRESNQAARYGGHLGEVGHFRVYANAFDRDSTRTADGQSLDDSANGTRAGFRMDFDGSRHSFRLLGDAYTANLDNPVARRLIGGAHLLSQWNKRLNNGSQLRLQTYYDRTERKHVDRFEQRLDIYDIELHYEVGKIGRHQLLWGGGHRHSNDHVINTPQLAFLPENVRQNWSNVFAQDTISLADAWDITLGLKAERNDYTGTEYLPNARLRWLPRGDQVAWLAYSRATRAPSRFDRDLFSPATAPFQIRGNENFDSEVANVFELGYRNQPTAALSYSVALFHHEYDQLASVEPTPTGPVWANEIEGRNTGIEFIGSYRLTRAWRLTGGWVAQRKLLQKKPGSNDIAGLTFLGNDPDTWWSIRSRMDIGAQVEWDVSLRRVGALPDPSVPGYTAVDMRLAWRPKPEIEISLTLQNLFDPQHAEWGPDTMRTEFERAGLLKVLWRL